MPYCKPRDGSELPGWQEDLNATHRNVRARVEHALAEMKTWILRDYRRPHTPSPTPRPASPISATSPSPADPPAIHAIPDNKINYETSLATSDGDAPN
jgi:hypothetical protein